MDYYLYILTNSGNSVLYTGVTNNLVRRVWQHKEKFVDGFTKRYNCQKLVYFEAAGNPESAIAREKQIKSGSRKDKLDLISSMNPDWSDLLEKVKMSFV